MNTQNGSQMWAKMLTEQFGVKDADKLNWVSEYAAIHEIHESAIGVNVPTAGHNVLATPDNANLGNYGLTQGTYANGVGPVYNTPLNTLGMGNPMMPYNPQGGAVGLAGGQFGDQVPGSGDIPVSTLPMALNIALMTISLELVPVIPAKAPWAMLSYMDFPYAGGKLGRVNETAFDGKGEGRENKPIYVKLAVAAEDVAKIADVRTAVKGKTEADDLKVEFGDFVGIYKTISMLDGGIVVEVIECGDISIREAFTPAAGETSVSGTIAGVAIKVAAVDFAEAMADFVDGFANFANGSKQPMSRAENETGTGNQLGLRLFTKMVQMGSYEVTGAVTRQQLQDLPLYGVDAVGKIMEAMQNEITQHINARILERVFRLGVANAAHQYYHNGTDLNLYFGGTTAKEISEFTGIAEYVDNYDNAQSWKVQPIAPQNEYDNFHTTQRRISSRMLAAANLIQVTGRRGRATWAVTNAQIATALQDCSDYVVAPMVNNLAQDGSQNLYMGGTVAGLKLYVNPYMAWDDTRICIGRKGNGNEPGVIFMPYILADTVSITAEGTMAPKMLINSRFAIVDAGFYPELQYYTIAIEVEPGKGISLF